ncbi:hypothetical protein Vretifemale_8195 [Volvox reticuliferus]|uniref:ABC transmembrane type-1 domain-containing protein n=1 Tax=Volvox reticuliferus TaxID=1737510 RepID=A0A8J4CC39_9CHLO|nr:hypothetical protein Vretifemale_8195 [Volvox reticuliferus]
MATILINTSVCSSASVTTKPFQQLPPPCRRTCTNSCAPSTSKYCGIGSGGMHDSETQNRMQPPSAHFTQRRMRGGLLISQAGPAGGMGGHGGGLGEPADSWPRRILVGLAVAYIALVVLVPFFNVFIQAFAKGIIPFLEHCLDPDFLHALKMTLLLALVTVPLNTVFGTVAAINLTRNDFPGKVFLMSLLDLPFSISPVVTGLMLTLLYGRTGWFAALLRETGISVVFAFTGMALATMFVTLPFVVRELIPILENMDLSQEEAARTLGANDWQVFWNVTLPNIRWGLLYGVILCNARAMGEFGAVSVISGNIIGKTQTLTLFVESAYKEYNTEAAFAAAVLLSILALGTLFIKDKVEQAAAEESRK